MEQGKLKPHCRKSYLCRNIVVVQALLWLIFFPVNDQFSRNLQYLLINRSSGLSLRHKVFLRVNVGIKKIAAIALSSVASTINVTFTPFAGCLGNKSSLLDHLTYQGYQQSHRCHLYATKCLLNSHNKLSSCLWHSTCSVKFLQISS